MIPRRSLLAQMAVGGVGLMAAAGNGSSILGCSRSGSVPAPTGNRSTHRSPYRPYPFGGPVPIVFAYGEPEQRGRQIGEQLRGFSPGLVAALTAGKLDNYLPKGPDRAMDARKHLVQQAESFMDLMRSRMGSDVVSEYLAELNGVADGAGVDRWDLWFQNLGDYFEVWQRQTQGQGSSTHAPPTAAETGRCSAVAAWGSATPHHKTVVGHNCDGPRFVVGMLPHVVTVIAPSKGNVILSGAPATNWGGHHICSDRVFVCGTALLGYGSRKRNLGVVAGPHGIARRWICQYANDRHEAFRMQQKFGGVGEQGGFWPVSSGVVFADAQGAVFVQGVADKLAILPPSGRDTQYMTNHLLSSDLADEFGAQLDAMESRIEVNSKDRYQSLSQVVDRAQGRLDGAGLVSVLSSHWDPSTGKESMSGPTVCQHGEQRVPRIEAGTLMSTVADFGARQVHICLGNPCENPISTIPMFTKEQVATLAEQRLAALRARQPVDFSLLASLA